MLDVASKRPVGIVIKLTKTDKKAEVLLGKDSNDVIRTYLALLLFSNHLAMYNSS